MAGQGGQQGMPVMLDGRSLTRAQVLAVARGATIELDPDGLQRVQVGADFLAAQLARREPIYGVSTGFGNNADRLLGTQRLRGDQPGDQPLHEALQHNLITSHAVCVGEPFPTDVVRAMLVIRINTLMQGHSGVRPATLEAYTALLNAGIVPVVPRMGSVGASGDLAPLSHLALVLLGGGEAFLDGQRMAGGEALHRAGLAPWRLSAKEGLALNNGTAQMLATAVLAADRMAGLLDFADQCAAMVIDAFAGRLRAFDAQVHALRPHPGQLASAARLRELLAGSTLADIPYHLVPRAKPWLASSWPTAELAAANFDLGWDWVPADQREGRERFYERFLPFRGGKKHQPQDSYSLRCVPQVHGAVRDALAQLERVIDIELNAVTDNPLLFPDLKGIRPIEDQVVSAGHFHGMPIALAMSYVKASIPVLASISERRLNKLLDPATNDGLPAFLVGNEDAIDSGLMIVQYTAAALVNDLASRAHPACVYSIPTSANAEDHVSMGANEGRHLLDMSADLARVLALELMVAAQALDLRRDMIRAASSLAREADLATFAAKIGNAPPDPHPQRPQFLAECEALRSQLASSREFGPGQGVGALHARFRGKVAFLQRDRALDGDVAATMRFVEDYLAAGRSSTRAT